MSRRAADRARVYRGPQRSSRTQGQRTEELLRIAAAHDAEAGQGDVALGIDRAAAIAGDHVDEGGRHEFIAGIEGDIGIARIGARAVRADAGLPSVAEAHRDTGLQAIEQFGVDTQCHAGGGELVLKKAHLQLRAETDGAAHPDVEGNVRSFALGRRRGPGRRI